jgi:hypothetical protein
MLAVAVSSRISFCWELVISLVAVGFTGTLRTPPFRTELADYSLKAASRSSTPYPVDLLRHPPLSAVLSYPS